LPGYAYRVESASHPYTVGGLQIDVSTSQGWMEIGECGLAHPELLRRCGYDPSRASGLAMGLGLDRILMLRKHIDDIRLLRSTDDRIAKQMGRDEK
jgi:phenylalanyl-tRNA synthetase alpha chain